MKYIIIALLGILFVFGYIAYDQYRAIQTYKGIIASGEYCQSVCVDVFEKFGC